MSSLISLLLETADPRPERLAKILGKDKEDVERELEKLRQDKTILGWMPILNPEKADAEKVRAVIEVKISPEREGDSIAWPCASPSSRRSNPAT